MTRSRRRGGFDGMIDRFSPNFDDRPDGVSIDILVLHYTGMETATAAIERMCDQSAKVSAHYVIDEDGVVCRLVAEGARAWHAGRSAWRGDFWLNGRSIGIELVNPGHEFGYRPFPDAQMQSLIELSRDILSRHPIPARNVVGHSDISPVRKQDPGELFDWQALAAAGVGLWPDDVGGGGVLSLADGGVESALEAIGYDVTDLAAAVRAFQRRFCPARVDGVADDETCARMAAVRALFEGS